MAQDTIKELNVLNLTSFQAKRSECLQNGNCLSLQGQVYGK